MILSLYYPELASGSEELGLCLLWNVANCHTFMITIILAWPQEC